MVIGEQVRKAKVAAIELAALDSATKDSALKAMAEALDRERGKILSANAYDVEAATRLKESGEMTDALVKRLKVNDEKIDGMIAGIEDVARLDDPVGETMSCLELDEALTLYQIRCPIGVLGVIFESRPDVVPQIMSLCLKSGNAVVFKGGREAAKSNRALFEVLRSAAISSGVPGDAFVLMETREDVGEILGMDGFIDLLIPRGSNSFVRYIQENTKIPVLGHAAGICHVYIDRSADMDKAISVALDSKIQYPAVCNAVETLLVDSGIAEIFLPRIARLFAENGVVMRVDERSSRILGGSVETVPAQESDWDEEYNDMVISVKIVDSVGEAAMFINTHGSHHTDAAVAEDRNVIATFVKNVDSADVFINASTRFADGYRFGKGAEVGISTNKIHARGPVGMEGLMIYKYVLMGDGQVVKDYVGTHARKFKHRKLDSNLVI